MASLELFFFLSQPDLLNFKKGWLTKQYEDGQVSVCVHSEAWRTGEQMQVPACLVPGGVVSPDSCPWPADILQHPAVPAPAYGCF